MIEVQRVIEVERVVNLVRGFGWEKTEEIIEDGTIKIRIEKKVESPVSSESQP